MAKIRLTINELKRQKNDLKRFLRFLPTLMLKKQNIQIELYKIRQGLAARLRQQAKLIDQLQEWVAVFGEEVGLPQLIEVDAIETGEANVAGVDLPVFRGVQFAPKPYDLYATPPWLDKAISAVMEIMTLQFEIDTLREQVTRLEEELRVTTQRVNLFEKVKIPAARERIRVIRIFLGDQQTAAVVRGKIAKGKGRSAARSQ